MHNNSELLLVHEGCQAGCSHCPFTKNNSFQLKMVNTLVEIATLSKARMILLSGGEPLEYPFLFPLIAELKSIGKPFRIATGGHIDILPVLKVIQNNRLFTGFSVGTDVMMAERNNNKEFKKQWMDNLKILSDWNCNYSLTITVDSEINLKSLLDLFKYISLNPDFFMLSGIEGKIFDDEEWNGFVQSILNIYPTKTVKTGFRECKNL